MREKLFAMLMKDHAVCVGAVGRRTLEALHTSEQTAKAESIIPGFRTLIIAAYPYNCPIPAPCGVSRYAASVDYHRVLPPLMESARKALENSGFNTRVLTDVSPFDERTCALACGIGIRGDNGLLIVPEYGSYVFLASILTDAQLLTEQEDKPADIRTCLRCGACRRACPYGALGEHGFNIDLCLSELSQRRHLTEKELEMLRQTGTLWGCDRCQEVCPYNKDAKSTNIPAFLTERLTDADMQEIAGLSNSAFRTKYSSYALSWRGAPVLRRNIENLKKE